MMRDTTGAILLVIGVVALFAAIVGGGVKIREIEVGSLPSRWRQLFLAVFGVVVGIIGLVMMLDNGEGGGGDETPTQNNEVSDQTAETNTADSAGETNSAEDTAPSAENAPAADENSGGGSTEQP